tara:strand:+ start:2319 stop:3635 length:1317 start_codon:yes stop_codon:yes gene_type:complete
MNQYKYIYVLGIGGSGMSSISKYLSQKGLEVKGYDQRRSFITNQLEQDGIKVEFNIENIEYSKDTLYIYSSAIQIEKTIFSKYLKNKNVISRPQFLNKLSKENKIIGVTGTHGKTSTTALLSHIFHYNNINVSYIYGGLTSFHGIGGHYGDEDKPLILETDEAFNTFKDIEIDDLLVTNIDKDHLDHFLSYDNLIEAFKHVISNVKDNLVLNFDDQVLNEIKIKNKYFSYASKDIADFTIIYPDKFKFEGNEYKIVSNLIGIHFVSNIVGAIALAYLNGIEINDSLLAIKSFPGVKRRTEYLGSVGGIDVYDDYGHHPTELKATIEALKEHSKGKLYVIFQPHRYTRTKNNFDDFKKQLSKSDYSIVVDIYPAGEIPIPGISSKNFEMKNIKYLKSMRMVPSYLSTRIKENDTVLTLGAGDITLLGPQILKYLDEKKN